jgi:hypothetical protein
MGQECAEFTLGAIFLRIRQEKTPVENHRGLFSVLSARL